MSRTDYFQTARWFKRINRTAQISLSVLLWIALNYIAASHFTRTDITRNHQFSLSPETLAYLDRIEDPVVVYVTRPVASSQSEVKRIFRDVQELLREYEYVGRRGTKRLIRAEFINIYEQREQARMLVEKYGIRPDQEHAIIVAREDGKAYREIMATELYDVKNEEIAGFKGEQAFTSAILGVANPERRKIYWLSGHGEMRVDDVDPLRGLSMAGQELLQRNLEIEGLDLTRSPDVPDDADLVVIAAPQAQLMPAEVAKLRQYLSQRNGRVIVLLEPGRPHGMDDLFFDWGILVDDMLVLDPSHEFRATGGDLFIGRFARHPVTDFLLTYQLRVLVGLSRPVREDLGAPDDERLTVIPIMGSSDDSWAERSYRLNIPHKYDPDTDLPGPVTLAALAERNVGTQIGLQIPGGRLAVFGNADFIANNRFDTLGNRILFSNVVNWTLDQDSLLNIPPRSVENFRLVVSRGDLVALSLRFAAIPGGVALLGFLIFIVRRR